MDSEHERLTLLIPVMAKPVPSYPEASPALGASVKRTDIVGNERKDLRTLEASTVYPYHNREACPRSRTDRPEDVNSQAVLDGIR